MILKHKFRQFYSTERQKAFREIYFLTNKLKKKPGFKDFFLGFLRLIRIRNLLIIVVTQLLVRIFLIGPKHDFRNILSDPALYLIIASTVCIAAAGYIINDYFDVKIDIVNKPERVIIGRFLKRRVAMGAHQFLNIMGVGFVVLVSHRILAVNIICVTLLWFYSERFKRLPFIGNFIVALLTSLSVFLLSLYYPDRRNLVVIFAIFSFFISLVREIIKDMEDVRGDEAHGARTLPIAWGLQRTKFLVYFFIIVFVGVLLTLTQPLHNEILSVVMEALLFPVALLTYKLYRADTRRDFARLSTLCKIIMLLGIGSMIWV